MNANETTPAVSINDYLLDNSPGVCARDASPYQVVLQTESDFIISRKRARTVKELVILVSKGLFYFKEKDKIEEVTYENLQKFLSGLRDERIKLEKVLWISALTKDSASYVFNIISSADYVAMASDNVLKENHNLQWCINYWKKNAGLYGKVHASIGNVISNYHAVMNTAFEIESKHGLNEALYFVEVFSKTGIEGFSASNSRYSYCNEADGFFGLLEKPYCLDLRRLIDYALVDAFSQGLKMIGGDFWLTYKEYLDMQIKIFGIIP